MTLRRKLLVGYGLTLGLVALVLLWAVVNMVNLGTASDAILRENFRSILAAENMIDAIERQDSTSLLMLLKFERQGLTQFRENETQFLQRLGRAEDNITIHGEAQILDDIEKGYSNYLVSFSSLRDVAATSADEAAAMYHDVVQPIFQQVRDACIELRDINEKTMFEASVQASRTARTAIWSTTAVGMGAIAFGLLLSLLLSRRLVHPLQEVLAASEQMADGNYNAHVEVEGTDELAQLAASFNTMAERLATYHRMNVERIRAEQKRSEAVLRSIDDGVVVVDVEMNVVNINRTATDILSIDSDAALGHHFLEVVRNDRLFELLQQTVNGVVAATNAYDDNILTLGQVEHKRDYMFSITPVITDENVCSGAVLVLRDVTRLKQLDRMKSEFVMTASHELRTPLQSIGMSIDLLREQAAVKLTDKEAGLLRTATEEVQRLKLLVNDLLDLSKIEAGKVEMDFVDVDVVTLIDKAVSVVSAQADERGIGLTTEVAEDISAIYADPGKIIWVLTNLIGNALRFVDRGGSILVSGKQIGDWVHLRVADNGQGIALEDQTRSFDKFVQLDSGTPAGGTGLGLAICREIVRAHKDRIWVDSKPGEGSTFTFTVPTSK